MFRLGACLLSRHWPKAIGGQSPCSLASGAVLGLLEGSFRLDRASGQERSEVLATSFEGRALEGVASCCLLHRQVSGPSPHA